MMTSRKGKTGLFFMALGIISGVFSRMTGESNMQDFLSGVLTGMSVGFFLMGIIGVLLSLANRKEG